jgi:hypothetical protein
LSNQGLPRLRFKKFTAALAAVGTTVLLSGVGAVVSAPLANADESPSALSVTCEAVSVNLHGYAAEVPAVAAVPGNPGQPGIEPTYETVVVTPAIPAIPAVPATYVQEWLYVQKNHPNQTKWEHEGWNGIVHGVDHGLGWHYVVPEQHRDTETILTPAIPAVPAVPAVTKQVLVDPGQPYIAPTPGTPAVPAKANTVKLTIDGTPVIDTTFGADFTSTKLVNPISAHGLHLQVTGWDGMGNIDRWDVAEPCVGPITLITLPMPEVTQPTGKCVDGELVLTKASVKLTPGEHYSWPDYGQDEHGVIHDVTPGEHIYMATPDWGYAANPVTVMVETLVSNECQPSVSIISTVTGPTAANPATCTTGGTLPTLPTAGGYTFAWNRPFDGPGTYTAIATASPGYIFKEGLKTSFDVVVAAKLSGEACATSTPTPTQPATTTPVVTKTATVIPSGTTAPTQATAANNQWQPDLAAHGGSSASTDVNPTGLIVATAAMVVVLVGIALLTRRRPRH